MAKSRLRQKRGPGPVGEVPFDFAATVKKLALSYRAWLPQFLLIAGITLWIYGPSLHGDFVWDDGWYITTNPLLSDANGLWKFWFQPGCWVEYYPIQETVLWLQWQLFGTHTLGYHLTSVLLHIFSALLVWRLLAKLGLKLAWLGGLLFAVHPVQVESVAWISELKNTLSLPFFLLAMSFWIDYDERRRKEDYQWAVLLFLLAMLCKITMAAFPVIILLYAWWKRGQVGWADARASAPFFVISLALGFATIWVGQVYEHGSPAQDQNVSLGGFPQMFARAGMILGYYFAKCFLPVDMIPVYPKWPTNAGSILAYVPWLVLAFALGWSWKERRRWGRHVLLGLGFFGIILGPFLGFHVVSYMQYAWVMDHFLYIPLIGLIALFVAGLEDFNTKAPQALRVGSLGLTGIAIAGMAWGTHSYAGWFVNNETLWSRTLARDPQSWLACINLGSNLIDQKRYDEAVVKLDQAIALSPNEWDGYYNLGFAYDKLGKNPEAGANYRKAMALNPGNPKSYLNLGEMLRRGGDTTGAEAMFRQGLTASPNDPALLLDLGNILLQTGRVPEATDLYERGVAANPDSPMVQYNLGAVLLKTGNLSEAADHLEKAVALDPKIASAHANLGVTLARLGRLSEAIEQFQAALEIDPHLKDVRDNFALALAQSGRIPEAVDQFQQALQENPNDTHARDVLAKLQQLQNGVAPH